MDFERFRTLFALPLASVFLILLVCVFVVQRPSATGIRIPMRRVRSAPLTNCEFNGFTVYLRSDGKVAGGNRDDVASMETMLSRIKEAADNIQDDTVFIITDPDVSYGQFTQLIGEIHKVAPPDHIGVVTREAQITIFDHLSGKPLRVLADRCRFEWPAVTGEPEWPHRDLIPTPLTPE